MTRSTPWGDLPDPFARSFEIAGVVVPYVRVGRERGTPRAKGYHAWQREFGSLLSHAAAQHADLPWNEGAIIVAIIAYRYKQTGDKDNIEKAVLDAAKGILWYDDAQIVGGGTRLEPCAKGRDVTSVMIYPCASYANRIKEARR